MQYAVLDCRQRTQPRATCTDPSSSTSVDLEASSLRDGSSVSYTPCAQIRNPAGAARLLADSAVDRLAQKVGVPVVARVLLDHVGEDPPEGDRTVVGMVEAPFERLALGDDAAGVVDLLPPD